MEKIEDQENRNESKNLSTVKFEMTCELCNRTFTSDSQYFEHLLNKQHQLNLTDSSSWVQQTLENILERPAKRFKPSLDNHIDTSSHNDDENEIKKSIVLRLDVLQQVNEYMTVCSDNFLDQLDRLDDKWVDFLVSIIDFCHDQRFKSISSESQIMEPAETKLYKLGLQWLKQFLLLLSKHSKSSRSVILGKSRTSLRINWAKCMNLVVDSLFDDNDMNEYKQTVTYLSTKLNPGAGLLSSR